MSKPQAKSAAKAEAPEEKKEVLSGARERIEQQNKQAELVHRHALLKRRLELAHEGVSQYEQHKMAEAVKSFLAYINILEEWKEVEEGGLHPGVFDRKKDAAELLLISGVYWDLAKLFDRTKSPAKYKQFRHYIDKYILFSKGMPFQGVCAETLRKYISNGKPLHREDFKRAYKVIYGSDCFVATALVDFLPQDTVPRLRHWRDSSLERSSLGAAFVRFYYRHGPAMARGVETLPWPLKRSLAFVLAAFAKRLEKPEGQG